MEQQYLWVAVKAAVEAGRKILKIYNDPKADFHIEKKADNSPVTIADKAANALITERLEDSTPYPILSEEGLHAPYGSRKNWPSMWVVDPLDGTKEFIKRNGEFTVNIAWVQGHSAEAGVIYIPVRKELYIGDTSKGAFRLRNVESLSEDDSLDKLIEKAERLPLKETHEGYVVVASRSFLNAETEAFIDSLRPTHPTIQTLSRGSSLKICAVAEGSADIYPRFAPTMEWDTAAGHAIVRAAGGEIVRTDGHTPLQYNKEDLHNPYFIVKR